MPDLIDGFLSDLVAHPEDPTLWLILADWLEDQNDPRAELVRLTWALSHEEGHPDFAVRQARVQALLAGGMRPVRPRLTLGPGLEFARVPPGSFWMGSPEDEAEREAEELLHRVTLTRGFWMGVTPVTQGQWQAVMGNNPSYFSRTGYGKDEVAGVSDDDLSRFPVEMVSWEDSQAFCAKLSEGLPGRITLPTEAEWEYACRAGTRTPFHFGAVSNGTQANCNGGRPYGTEEPGPHLDRPTVVGSFSPNAWGLFDCHGQVWEWCEDWYDKRYYSRSEGVDPKGSLNGIDRVLRGGSFYFESWHCRAAGRDWHGPGRRINDIGFRVCFRPD
jgi:uncharacterized protein (TIGR02996 family)